MDCPTCSSVAPDYAEFCPSCLGDLTATPSTPGAAAASAASASMPYPGALADEPPRPEGDEAAPAARPVARAPRPRAWGPLVAQLATVFGFIGAAFFGLPLLGFGFVPWLAALAVFCGAAFVMGAVSLIRARLRHDTLPNLRLAHGDAVVREFDDVQFVLVPFNGELQAGGESEVQFLFQNCCDQPRRVQLLLDADSANIGADMLVGGWTRGYAYPEVSGGLLGPGETASLTVPVQSRGADAPLELWVRPSATGMEGRRVRHWHAEQFVDQVGAASQALGLLGGWIRWGGGSRLRFVPVPGTAARTRPLTQPNATWTITHSPSDAELDRAVRGER